MSHPGLVTIVVDDSDRAIRHYVDDLDFDRDHAAFGQRGPEFEEEPQDEACWRVVVFRDLFGNRWDLIATIGRLV